ncbi:MAG: hypothetical protein L3J92_05580 [Thermoplasmata archaeon]|nr:hypothetical protein [Thermoplasmata archaeon]
MRYPTSRSNGPRGRTLFAIGVLGALVVVGGLAGVHFSTAQPVSPIALGFLAGSPRPQATSIGVGINPTGVAYDSGKGEIFVTNYGSNNVSVINSTTDTYVGSVPVEYGPFAAAYDAAKGEVFVADWASANVSVIDDSTNTIVRSVPVGNSPYAIAYDSAKGEMFVTNRAAYNLSVINDTTYAVTTITLPVILTTGGPVADIPLFVAYDGARGEVFLTAAEANASDLVSDHVLVYNDTNDSLVADFAVGSYSADDAAVYDSGQGEVFVTDAALGTVVVVSDATNAVVTSVGAGLATPDAVAYVRGMGEVLVANFHSDNVSVLNDTSNTVTATIPVGMDPDQIAYDGPEETVFVSNGLSNNVTVIPLTGGAPPTYTVTASETGLTPGTGWSVALNGTEETSTTSTIQFVEPDGGYSYTIGSVAGYVANVTSGTLTVDGAALALSITFTPVVPGTYALSVTESGLSTGTNWSVEVGTTVHFSTSLVVEFELRNGTYTYQVGNVKGFGVSPTGGEVNISGTAVKVLVAFIATGASTPPPSTPPPTSTGTTVSSTLEFAIIGGVLFALVLVVILLVARRKREEPPIPPTPPGPS